MDHVDEHDQPELTAVERSLLRTGLNEWGGPANLTDAMAIAMGFADAADYFVQSDRLRDAIGAGTPLSRRDWTRALLATEIVFASDVVGSGYEWRTTTGLDDDGTLRVLRALQLKLVN